VIRIIAIIDDQLGLANEQGIPWDLPNDKRYFRQKTNNNTVLMGKKTYLTFNKPLPNRINMVITGSMEALRPGFFPVQNLETFLSSFIDKDLWIIGGANLFDQSLKYANELYLTKVEGNFNCINFFPKFDEYFTLSQKSSSMNQNGLTFYHEVWLKKK
jgi:dihydrofolate reductase